MRTRKWIHDRQRGRTAVTALAAAALATALAVAPAHLVAASTVIDLYAYPGGTGTTCTANTGTGADCDLAAALAQAGGAAAQTANVFLESTAASFTHGPYVLDIAGPTLVTIAPTASLLPGTATIDGSGYTSSILTVSGTGALTIDHVALVNADATGNGGAIDDTGTVALNATNDTFTNDHANGNGGAIDVADATTGSLTASNTLFGGDSSGADGGAIDSGDHGGHGTLSLSAATLGGDSAVDGGAIASGDHNGTGSVTIEANTTLDGNHTTGTAPDGNGGAIDSGDFGGDGMVSISDSSLSGNTAANNGGAIDSGDYGGSGTVSIASTVPSALTSSLDGNTATGGDGGAIDSGDGEPGYGPGTSSATIDGVDFAGNKAGNSGGVIDNGDGGASVGHETATLTVANSVFDGNSTASGAGGAIDNGDGANTTDALSVTGTTFQGNHSGDFGGAIANADDYGTSSATIASSRFVGNTVLTNGTAGGAISNGTYNGDGTLTITDSTFTGNGTLAANFYGGAIVNAAGAGASGTVTVNGSTFLSNSADVGGAIANAPFAATNSGTVSVSYSTFVGDSAITNGGAISNAYNSAPGNVVTLVRTTVDNVSSTVPALYDHQTMIVAGSVVAGTGSALCAVSGKYAQVVSDGYNLEQDASSCGFAQPTDHAGVDPQLGAVQNNGGPTETELPASSSPLVKAIPFDQVARNATPAFTATVCALPDVDQRGVALPVGEYCTIGSVDIAYPIVIIPPPTTTTSTTTTTTTTVPPTTTTTTPTRPARVSVSVYFAASSPNLTRASRVRLARFAVEVVSHHVSHLVVTGYADPTGPARANVALSLHRARVVAAFLNTLLRSRGHPVRFSIVGRGVLTTHADLALDRVVIVTG